jgi:hypothetical protein
MNAEFLLTSLIRCARPDDRPDGGNINNAKKFGTPSDAWLEQRLNEFFFVLNNAVLPPYITHPMGSPLFQISDFHPSDAGLRFFLVLLRTVGG